MITQELIDFQKALANKGEKISSSDPAYILGVNKIPRSFKALLSEAIPSKEWAFEGSVGRGSWSRTPWIAIFDQRATSRASDGFFIAALFAEDFKSVFLVLMNTSSEHFNYTPFKITQVQAGSLNSFNSGKIPKKQLSESGRGIGPEFENSSLLWKKFEISTDGLQTFGNDLVHLAKHYQNLVSNCLELIPIEKPFKDNPFLLK